MSNILMITCDDGFFASSRKSTDGSTNCDVTKISNYFEQAGHHVEIHRYGNLDFSLNYNGWFVLFASREDPGLFYKDYIEDCILRLQYAGAILLPSFDFFRSHHNKCYMELLRTSFSDELNTIKTQVFSGYDEFLTDARVEAIKFPAVVKTSAGAGGSGVVLAKNRDELLSAVKKISYRVYHDRRRPLTRADIFNKPKNLYRKVMRIPPVKYRTLSGKFIVQTFIAGLKFDYKVLVFGDKYYVLRRGIRDDDFRASGSGKFLFPSEVNEIMPVLEFAKRVFTEINMPLASLDIAYDGQKCHLLEYQCICFGPYTLQFSEWFFTEDKIGWSRIDGASEFELEYARAVGEYIQKLIK